MKIYLILTAIVVILAQVNGVPERIGKAYTQCSTMKCAVNTVTDPNYKQPIIEGEGPVVEFVNDYLTTLAEGAGYKN